MPPISGILSLVREVRGKARVRANRTTYPHLRFQRLPRPLVESSLVTSLDSKTEKLGEFELFERFLLIDRGLLFGTVTQGGVPVETKDSQDLVGGETGVSLVFFCTFSMLSYYISFIHRVCGWDGYSYALMSSTSVAPDRFTMAWKLARQDRNQMVLGFRLVHIKV